MNGLHCRGSWNKLTARLIGQMFLCALLGLTLSQYLFLVGLDYTSATFTCAFINLVPVVTFVLALALRMEKVNLKRKSGKGKVIGTLTCVVGATTLSFYKGMRLIKAGHDVLKQQQGRAKGLGTGSAFLFAGSIAWSSWFLIQSKIGHNFPYTYSSTSIMSLFSAVQSALLFLITDRNMSKWIVKGYLHILSVVYAGIVGSGLCYVVMSWCVKKKGPVFTSAFSPLIQIFAGIFDVLVLHEDVYLGSILGSIVVIVGMYILLWGKSKDEEICEALPKRIMDADSGQREVTNH
ncbi:hypothetical protein ACS0TY_019969 [Phlomoides rotata]